MEYVWDFRDILPSPWGPLPKLIVTVSIFPITFFQQVLRNFSLTLYYTSCQYRKHNTVSVAEVAASANSQLTPSISLDDTRYDSVD
jgi:hypothetical protein